MSTVRELEMLSLVPLARLGRLFRQQRWVQRCDLDALAERTAGRFVPAELEAVEEGRRPLTDEDVVALAAAYRVRAERTIRPRHTRLEVDPVSRSVSVRGTTAPGRPGEDVDDVLLRYLALIYVLRSAVPGSPIGLRHDDVTTLAGVLDLPASTLQDRLGVLMTNPRDRLGRCSRRLARRAVVPAAGILVANTGERVLVLDGSGGGPGGGLGAVPERSVDGVFVLARRDTPAAIGLAARSA